MPDDKGKNIKNKDIIDIILNDNDDRSSPDLEALDCLIYRSSTDIPVTDSNSFKPDTENCEVLEISRGNVSVKIWKTKTKIKLRFSPELKGNISIKRIADIAIDAILKELQKETK